MLNTARWTPFEGLSNLHREVDRAFGWLWEDTPGYERRALLPATGFVPPTELYSDDNAWHVRMALPGIDPQHVQIDVSDNVLSVVGERSYDPGDARFGYRSEIQYGRFARRFTVPERVDADSIQASFTNGMLEIVLPLKETAKPRRIPINGDGLLKRLSA